MFTQEMGLKPVPYMAPWTRRLVFSRIRNWSTLMKLRFAATLALLSTFTLGLGCSAGGDDDSKVRGGSSSTGGSGSTGGGSPPGLGGGPSIIVGGGTGVVDPNDPRMVPVRQKFCDASGKCTCLRLALLGTLESAAIAKDTKPFIDWLNGNSDGTATVTLISAKPTLDEAFFANYDIIVVANVNGWAFSDAEKASTEKWVREMGGGIVTLTGFSSEVAEVAATSQLVAFAGMGYEGAVQGEAAIGGDWTATQDKGVSTPIHYKGGTVDLRNCLYRWSSPIDTEAGNTTAIQFTPQTGTLEKLTASLTYVGAYIGWGAKAPAGSTVIAKDPVSGKNMAVAYEVDGTGRIFTFGDEWIVFTNQWQPTGTFTNGTMTAGEMCWQPADGTTPGFYHSVRSLYQTKQFWYNIINWVAPPSECNFTITDSDVVVK
jgi:hypothetical protein